MLTELQTISQCANQIRLRLHEWAQPRGGRVEVMANQRHLWEALADLPSAAEMSPRVLVLYAGESLLLPDQPDCRRVRRNWQVVVVRGRGFKSVAEHDPMSGGVYEPFTDSVETVRDLVRTMLNISDLEELPSVIYVGVRPLPSVLPTKEAGAFMDAMVVEFATHNDIPAVVLEAPGTDGVDAGTLPGEY